MTERPALPKRARDWREFAEKNKATLVTILLGVALLIVVAVSAKVQDQRRASEMPLKNPEQGATR